MKVSVIIPCFNHQDLLDQTLRTIEWQRNEFDECLVVDDGSRPKLTVPKWVRLERIERPPVHRSAAPARCLCWDLAQGDLVVGVDASMLLLYDTIASLKANRKKLEEQFPHMLQTVRFFGLKNRFTVHRPSDVESLVRDAVFGISFNADEKVMEHNVSMMSRKTYDMVGGYDESTFTEWGMENQDFDMMLYKKGGIINSSIPRISREKPTLLVSLHNYHDEPRDKVRCETEFVNKWGEPFSEKLFQRIVDEARGVVR